MPLVINNDLMVKLCTKAGNSTDNKGGFPKQTAVEFSRVVDQYDYRGGKIVVLRPIIDKLVLDYNFDDCKSKKKLIDDIVVDTAKKLFGSKNNQYKGFEVLAPSYLLLRRLNKTHKFNFFLRHQKSDSKVAIQLQGWGKGRFFRCEFNPDKLQKSGMDDLKSLLDALFKNDIYPITYQNIFDNPKGINRIDIAVDMLGVDACDLEGRYLFKNKALKGHVYESPNGRLETFYFVLPDSDKGRCYWYNKGKEAGASDKTVDGMYDGSSSPYQGVLHTRYEFRILNSTKPLSNLHSFLNHLSKVTFRAMDYDVVVGKDFTYFLFLRYALNRTKEKALEMIPKDKRSDYSVAFDSAVIDIWDANKIWKKGWLAELN
ncbi:MAG TPA: hypothetical protein DCM27_02185, partial [Rhodospirillaceae bacterium]|nr:hypothetical protein [Rhodospirillaceae bacterium]